VFLDRQLLEDLLAWFGICLEGFAATSKTFLPNFPRLSRVLNGQTRASSGGAPTAPCQELLRYDGARRAARRVADIVVSRVQFRLVVEIGLRCG